MITILEIDFVQLVDQFSALPFQVDGHCANGSYLQSPPKLAAKNKKPIFFLTFSFKIHIIFVHFALKNFLFNLLTKVS